MNRGTDALVDIAFKTGLQLRHWTASMKYVPPRMLFTTSFHTASVRDFRVSVRVAVV